MRPRRENIPTNTSLSKLVTSLLGRFLVLCAQGPRLGPPRSFLTGTRNKVLG